MLNYQTMITILDYGVGNIESVKKAFEHLGQNTQISSTQKEIENAKILVIPGQGAFGQAIHSLKEKNLIEPILAHLQNNKPFLGICLGFQLLFEFSEEDGGQKGLGFFKGTVSKMKSNTLKIPHMGWNELLLTKNAQKFNLKEKTDAYFVHSYHVTNANESEIVTYTSYTEKFVSSIYRGKVFATQFHPEKSGAVGLDLLSGFLTHVK